MNALTKSNNPYLASDVSTAPFAGRQKIFEFLYQQVTSEKCSIVLGRRDSGKTAVLRRFGSYFDDSFISVYLPLKETSFQGQNELFLALAEATLKMMVERNFSLSRVVQLQPDAARMREWFADTFLPEVSKVVRSERLIFLLDDAGALLKAVQDGRMPNDLFNYLYELRKKRPELAIVLAMDSRYEGDIAALSPLVGLTDIIRLGNLTEEETAWLLRKPAEGEYTVNDEAVKAVYRAAGGQPRLLQRFGSRLYSRWDVQSQSRALTADDVKAIIPQVYNQSEADFQRIWSAMTRNERLILAAISQLQYAHPLAVVDALAIEHWLIESDYPLDITSVHVAMRGLEYEDMTVQTPEGIRIAVGLMQTWLLENGLANEKSPPTGERRIRLWWAAIAVLLVLVIVLVLIAGQQRSDSPSQDALPTVTLVTTPE